jgi:hypothetical protein
VHLAPRNSSNIFGYGNQEWWKAIGIVRQDLWLRKKSQEWGCFIDNNNCWLPPRKTLWNKHLCLRYSQEIGTHSSFVSANTGPNWRPWKGAAYGSVMFCVNLHGASGASYSSKHQHETSEGTLFGPLHVPGCPGTKPSISHQWKKASVSNNSWCHGPVAKTHHGMWWTDCFARRMAWGPLSV